MPRGGARLQREDGPAPPRTRARRHGRGRQDKEVGSNVEGRPYEKSRRSTGSVGSISPASATVGDELS